MPRTISGVFPLDANGSEERIHCSQAVRFLRASRNAAFALGAMAWLLASLGQAAIPPRPKVEILPLQANAWLRSGAAIGGQAAADELSLLRVERKARADGGERVILHYGDKAGRPLRAQPGYFHLAIDRTGRRLSVDLAQVGRTAVDRRDLEKIFAGSRLVAGSDIVMDPVDGSTHLAFALRSASEAHAMVEPGGDGEAARVAIDYRPATTAAGAAK